MLLYLTSNLKNGLIDDAVRQKELTTKKLTGKFSLRSFVTKDMRNYTTAKYFVVDYDSAEEKINDFTVALQSFQMMFSARIIVILSGCEYASGYIDSLVSIGITNIVTADTPDDVTDELIECLSPDGMRRYIPRYAFEEQATPAAPPAPKPEAEEIIRYKWSERNIKIAVAGTQRRSGVTVTAFNLAAWLAARGAEVCYIELNTNRHLQLLLNVFEAKRNGEHYVIDEIDCYLTNEPDRDYNFIIYDCGAIQTPSTVFKEADIRLLCGSILPYEAPTFHKTLSACGGLSLCKVALSVPQEFQEYCVSLFGDDVTVAGASHDLFANNVNGHIYQPLVQGFIVK